MSLEGYGSGLRYLTRDVVTLEKLPLALRLNGCAFCSYLTKMLCLKDFLVEALVPQPTLFCNSASALPEMFVA